MRDAGRRLVVVAVFAVAMALLEAVVVVYIRRLLVITDEQVSLGYLLTTEVWREAATLVMLAAVGWLAGRRRAERLAFSLFAFGLWDIWYYVWLWVFIDWPGDLLDWDILFLIPLRWWGPVLSPMLIAVLMSVSAALAVRRLERGERLEITPARVGGVMAGGMLALYVFMSDSLHALLRGQEDWHTLRPGPFKWPLFLLALGVMAWSSWLVVGSRELGSWGDEG